VHLIVTHKSILRAMICTALGLPPAQFRCEAWGRAAPTLTVRAVIADAPRGATGTAPILQALDVAVPCPSASP
jgi:broad specificity phosphatase PhoE